MYNVAKPVLLLLVCGLSLINLCCYFVYISPPVVRMLAVKPFNNTDVQNLSAPLNGTPVTNLRTPAVRAEKVLEKVYRGVENPIPTDNLRLQEPPDGVFQNFSISFKDFKHNRPLPPVNVSVKVQKFVFTLPTSSSTAQSTINATNRPTTPRAPSRITRPPNPHPYNYSINQPAICSGNKSELLTIIVVCSALGNLEVRQAIRETWGSQLHQWKTKMVFMIGGTNDTGLQRRVLDENQRFNDIVQEDFMDTYRNLSLKSVAMLKWVKLYCSNAKFVLKTDDDMFINVKKLYSLLSEIRPVRSIIGKVIINAMPVQTKSSKWYTPKKDFPAPFYPKYCSGTAYVISVDIIPQLYNTTLYTPIFWLEDVYITGICAKKIKPRYISSGGFSYNSRPTTGCAYHDAITGHKVSIKDMRKIWKELQALKRKCPVVKRARRPAAVKRPRHVAPVRRATEQRRHPVKPA